MTKPPIMFQVLPSLSNRFLWALIKIEHIPSGMSGYKNIGFFLVLYYELKHLGQEGVVLKHRTMSLIIGTISDVYRTAAYCCVLSAGALLSAASFRQTLLL